MIAFDLEASTHVDWVFQNFSRCSCCVDGAQATARARPLVACGSDVTARLLDRIIYVAYCKAR